MPYHLFRMSLLARRRPPLLDVMMPPAPRTTRQEHLSAAFSGRVDFAHRGIQFAFVPVTKVGEVIAGRLGRPAKEFRTSGPDTAFEPIEEAGHIATNIFIDTAGDPDGQKIAVQINPKVGAPGALMDALIQRVNDRTVDAEWQIEVRSIIDETSFWATVEQNAAIITYIQFKLVAPNVLGLKDNVTREMRQVRDENNGAQVTVAIENKDGIRLATASIRNAVHYVSEGGGDVVLKAKRKKLFDSKRKQRNIFPPEDATVSKGSETVLRRVMMALFGR